MIEAATAAWYLVGGQGEDFRPSMFETLDLMETLLC